MGEEGQGLNLQTAPAYTKRSLGLRQGRVRLIAWHLTVANWRWGCGLRFTSERRWGLWLPAQTNPSTLLPWWEPCWEGQSEELHCMAWGLGRSGDGWLKSSSLHSSERDDAWEGEDPEMFFQPCGTSWSDLPPCSVKLSCLTRLAVRNLKLQRQLPYSSTEKGCWIVFPEAFCATTV